MDNEYWTTEHAEQIENNIDETQRIYDALEATQAEHEKGGKFFKTTQKLLETYRPLRFDAVNEKMLKTAESIGTESEEFVTLDSVLSMPELHKFYAQEVESFIHSTTPITMGLFVHVVDAGIKILEFAERDKTDDLKYSDILKAVYIDEEKSPRDIAKDLKTNWATFYRRRTDAITALSIVIFGPLGCRHPSSLFDDNRLKKKFGHLLDVADTLDLLYELSKVKVKYEQEK